MVKNPVDMNLVFKRNSCMSDTRGYTEAGYNNYLNAHQIILDNKPKNVIKEAVKDMIKSYSTKANIKEGYKRCFGIFEQLYARDYDDILSEAVHQFSESVIPYCENLQTIIEYTVSNKIGQHNIDKIVENANQYVSCDYMIKNHNKLIKRFTTDSILPIGKHTPVSEMCRTICEMVDTYDIKPKIKMKLCLEEIIYFSDKNGISCNEQDMVESVVNYFLSIPNTDDTINDYRKVIKESKLLSMKADRKVKFLTEEKSIPENRDHNSINDSALYELSIMMENYGNDKVKDLIDKYKLDADKTDSKFQQVLRKVFTESPKNIIDDTPDILKWIRNFAILTVAAQSSIVAIITFLVNGYMHFDMRKKEAERVIKYFENEKDSIESQIYRTSNDDKLKKLNSYSDELEKAIKKLKDYGDSLYTQDELMNKDDYDTDFYDEAYALDEDTHKVIMGNLIADAMQADDIIDKIEKQNQKEIPTQQTEIKDTITKESALRYIDPDGRISFVLRSYDTSNCTNKTRLYESTDSIIKIVNNALFNGKGKLYYTMMENCIDFVFRSKFKVITTLQEDQYISNNMTDSEIMRLSFLVESTNLFEEFANIEPSSLVDKAIKRIDQLSYEQAAMFIESWGCGVPIEKDEISRFVNEYCTYQIEMSEYVDSYNLQSLFEKTSNNDTKSSLVDIVESTKIMRDIVTEGVDLNSLKLAWMGFKKKMKGMSAKEQEVSRDLDMNFNNLIRGAQSFYKVTDHREQLIRGQVCPSLSKIIKIGLSLAVLGVASGGVILPAITAVTGIALSKNANDKERKFIVDEYDIELQVVEREIKKIEDSGKSGKKYRALLSYQKSLQRGKQQIVYHLHNKKNIPFSASAGLKGDD